MKAAVFLGPSLPREVAREIVPEAVILPPVTQGDVIRVARRRPRVIAIIDGYFERVPAVWHKEILWAMAQGIHVLGSSSMGALRAAELAPFGMIGVGWIFEAYRAGLLEDDDEVAVVHAPADAGYRPLSEAMVNIRRTLARAVEEGVVPGATAEALVAAGKQLFYPERAWPRILQRGAEIGLPREELAALRAWLPGRAVAQKRDDAVALLHALRQLLDAEAPPRAVRYVFQHTEWWDAAARGAGVASLTDGTDLEHDALVEELRLRPRALADALSGALLRAFAAGEAERRGYRPGEEELREALLDLARAHGIADQAALEGFVAAQQLHGDELGRLLHNQAIVSWARAQHGRDANELLADELRASGRYGALHARALAKRRRLVEHGLEHPGPEDAGMDREALVAWFFDQVEMAPPEDLEHFSRALGFADADALLRAIARERCFQRLEGDGR